MEIKGVINLNPGKTSSVSVLTNPHGNYWLLYTKGVKNDTRFLPSNPAFKDPSTSLCLRLRGLLPPTLALRETSCTRPESLLIERRCVTITVLMDKRGRGRPWASCKDLRHIRLTIVSQSQGRGTGGEI